jgi:HEAT repeat protein
MSKEVEEVLARLRRAKSVDEGDEYADQLAKIAKRHVAEIIDLYSTRRNQAVLLVWSLQGLLEPRVLRLFEAALKDRDAGVRWAAAEGLKHTTDRSYIPAFCAALKDRYDLVKCVAVEWLATHGDRSAIAPLRRLLSLPSFRKNSPGLVKTIERALPRLAKRLCAVRNSKSSRK